MKNSVCVLICAVLLFAASFLNGCGTPQHFDAASVNKANVESKPIATALNDIVSIETPQGVNPEVFQLLKNELARLLIINANRTDSVAPAGEANRITDLEFVDIGTGNWRLTWSYVNIGDYDQNGEVGVPDITPIAQHYLHAQSGGVWPDALDEVIDGDGSGEIGISDITAIAQNYLSTVTGYAIETSSNPGGPWGELTIEPMNTDAVDARRIFTVVPMLDMLDYVRVVPVGIGTERGDASNIVTTTYMPPEITGVSPLTGASGAIVRFSANATGWLPFTYNWNFGGGTTPDTSTDAEPLVTLGTGGVYNCSVTITNEAGNDTFNFDLTITGAGNAPDITWVDPTIGLTATDITLNATVSGAPPLSYAWDFGGGATPATSTAASPTVTLGAVGDYNASLTVSNAFGSDIYDFTLYVVAEDSVPPVWDDSVGIVSLTPVINTNTLQFTFGRATDAIDMHPFYIVYWNKTADWNAADLENMYYMDLWDVDPEGTFPSTGAIIGLEPGVEYTVLIRTGDHALPEPNLDSNSNVLTATVDANGLMVSEIVPDAPNQPAGTIVTFSATVSGGDGNYDAVWSDNAPDYGYFFEPDVTGANLSTRWGCAQGEVWPGIRVEVTDGSGHSGIQELGAYYVAPGTPLSFTSDVYSIVSTNCTGCHGSSGGLNMTGASTALANLVGIPSSQQASLNRIEPFDPASSYLIRKISGDMTVTGQRMPPGSSLPTTDTDTIIRWVIGGALE